MITKPVSIIPLHGKYGRGKFAIVDGEDYEELSQHKWYGTEKGYATTLVFNAGVAVRMNRKILGLTDRSMVSDHINRNKLDNRKCNLRAVTPQQNNMNTPPQTTNTTGFKGVYEAKYVDGTPYYIAQIRFNGEQYYLGAYVTAKEAAHAYDNKAREHFGEFAYLNFPDEYVVSDIVHNRKPRKGYYFDKTRRKWRAVFKKDRKRYYNGQYKTEEEAKAAAEELRARLGSHGPQKPLLC
jgi:hypothetical protein